MKNRCKYPVYVLGALLCVLSFSCVTEPVTGRWQLVTSSRQEEEARSREAWQELQAGLVPSRRTQLADIVSETGRELVRYIEDDSVSRWSFYLFEGADVNAFSLPDGKVALYEGIFLAVRDQAELAAVIGHEIAHVTARHGGERMSQQELVDAGRGILETALSSRNAGNTELWIAAYTGISRAGYLCPYSREHEYSADRLSMIYMAMAGYDPQAALDFWGRLPENGRAFDLFATHPANEKRLANLRRFLPEAQAVYNVSRRMGRGCGFTVRSQK